MSSKIDTINYRGFEIEVHFDMDAEDPREWMDHFGIMVCFHRKYKLGDSHDFDSPNELFEFLDENDHVKLPLFLYDHGGITMSTGSFSCPWDSGQVGYIYVTKEEVLNEGLGDIDNDAGTREKVLEILQAEVKEYDHFIRGDVYGYTIDSVDSCWGFYGPPEESGLLDEAKANIDAEIESIEKEEAEEREKNKRNRFSKIKALIKHHVPLEIRERLLESFPLGLT